MSSPRRIAPTRSFALICHSASNRAARASASSSLVSRTSLALFLCRLLPCLPLRSFRRCGWTRSPCPPRHPAAHGPTVRDPQDAAREQIRPGSAAILGKWPASTDPIRPGRTSGRRHPVEGQLDLCPQGSASPRQWRSARSSYRAADDAHPMLAGASALPVARHRQMSTGPTSLRAFRAGSRLDLGALPTGHEGLEPTLISYEGRTQH
jgi:hypothetical protein